MIPAHCASNYHLFYVLLPDRATRDGLLAHLNANGIHAVFHYVPLHTSPMGRSFGYKDGDLPVTEDLSGRLLRLPLFHDITEADQARVVDEVSRYLRGAGRPTQVAKSLRSPAAVPIFSLWASTRSVGTRSCA